MTRNLFYFLLAYPLLTAFSLSPMSTVIDLESNQKQAQFLLDNPTSEPMAVEISLRERIQKEDGSEETPVSKELYAMPPQLIIPPKEKRTVRVEWKGNKPSAERAFRVVAEQLPLEVSGTKKKGSGIKMLIKYVAALYVNPGSTSAQVNVVSVDATPDALLVTLENKGSAHQLLARASLTFTKGSEKIKLEGDQLKGLIGENILASVRRTFRLKPHPRITKEFQGTLKVD